MIDKVVWTRVGRKHIWNSQLIRASTQIWGSLRAHEVDGVNSATPIIYLEHRYSSTLGVGPCAIPVFVLVRMPDFVGAQTYNHLKLIGIFVSYLLMSVRYVLQFVVFTGYYVSLLSVAIQKNTCQVCALFPCSGL